MTLRERADLLIQELESALAEKDTIAISHDANVQEERRLRNLEESLAEKYEQLVVDRETLKKESDFLENERQRIKIEGAKVAKYEDLELKIQIDLDELDARKEDIRKKEDALDVKRQSLLTLEQKEKDLLVREQKIEKENAISAERQRLFELRESRISATEKRLRLDDAYAAIPQS